MYNFVASFPIPLKDRMPLRSITSIFAIKTYGRSQMKSIEENLIFSELDAPIYRDATLRTQAVINAYLAKGRYLQSAFVVNLLSRWWRKLKRGITAGTGGCAGEYGLNGEFAGRPLKIRAGLES
jgi:hypothetical protein